MPSLRMVGRYWTNALNVALALGLGLGLTIAVFAVLSELLLQPPPYPEPERVIVSDGLLSEADLKSWRESTRAMDAIAGVVAEPVTVASQGVVLRADTARVSSTLFEILRGRPVAGRVFGESDPADAVAVVAEGTARRLFGSVEAAVGKRVLFDGLPVDIVGVLPASFRYPASTVEYWRPIGRQTIVRRAADGRVSVRATTFPVIGRLEREATISEAQAELDAVLERGRRREPLPLVSFQSAARRHVREPLLLLQSVVILLLGLGVCNAALLMFAHYSARGGEFAVRSALGATRGRILRTLAGESVVIGLLGALTSLGTAWLGLALLRRVIGPDAEHVQFENGLLTAGVVAAVLLLVLASLAAASTSLRRGQAVEMRLRGSIGRSRIRRVLLTAQMAAVGLLVIASVSAISSLRVAADSIPASVSRDVLAADVHLSGPAYETIGSRVTFAERMIGQLADAGLSAAMAGSLPFSEMDHRGRLRLPGHPRANSSRARDLTTRYVIASPGFFDVMGWPLLQGRSFLWNDSRDSTPVVVITRSLALERFGHGGALGKYLRFSTRGWQIVGVVDDVPAAPGLPGLPTAYVSMRQLPPSAQLGLRSMTILVRAGSPALDAASRLHHVANAIDPGVALSRVSTVQERYSDSAAFLAFFKDLLSTLAVLAVALGAFGVYGVVSAVVGERRSEIAVRLALGSTTGRVFASIMQFGMRAVVAGLMLAVPGAIVLHGMFRAAVPGILPLGVLPVIAVMGIMAGVVILACMMPAIRAMRVDPGSLLKS